MPEEIWKDIPGYEGLYQVSDLGKVRSLDRVIIYKNGQRHFYRGMILSPGKNISGYLNIRLGSNGRETGVHRLVAEAFIPNPDKKQDVNHINGDKADNRAKNLEWCTRAENMNHCKNVLGKQTGRTPIKIRCIETGEIFDNLTTASLATGASVPHLSDVLNKTSARKIAGGLHWEKIAN